MLRSVKQFNQRVILPLHTLDRHTHTLTLRHHPPSLIPRTKSTQPSTSRFQIPQRTHSTWEDYPDTIVTEEESMAYTKSIGSSTSSTKRKRGLEARFYAVVEGKVPGIYQTWPEAQAQTKGFGWCKKFDTLKEAEAFMEGATNPTAKSGKTKYYGVAVGHVPGVYTDWKSVQAQIKSCKGADQKSFSTREEAEAYVNSNGPISLRGDRSETSSLVTGKMDKMDKIVEPAPKRQKKENAPPASLMANGSIKIEPGMGPLPPDAVDGFDRNIKLDPDSGNIREKTPDELNAVKTQPSGDFSGPIVVYTDGSSLGNGKVGAVAGVGVYFGPNDPRNVSEPLRGERQTNQRAELVAIARALDHIPIDRSAEIITDSNYSIKCLEVWSEKWERPGQNSWKNAAGKDVENQDLIKPILARIRERRLCKADTKLTWIKGHNNHPGNVAADALAVAGSRSSTRELRDGEHRQVSETLRTHYTPPGTKKQQQERFKQQQQLKLSRSPDGLQTLSTFAHDGDEFEEIFANLEAENAGNPVQDQYVLSPVTAKLERDQTHQEWRDGDRPLQE